MKTGTVNRTLAELDADLKKLLEDRKEAKDENELDDINEHIQQTKKQIGEIFIRRMQALVDALAPFFGWSKAQVKNRMKAFEEEFPSQRIKRYNETLKFLQNIEAAFAIATTAAA